MTTNMLVLLIGILKTSDQLEGRMSLKCFFFILTWISFSRLDEISNEQDETCHQNIPVLRY